jgi:hypothetical protein
MGGKGRRSCRLMGTMSGISRIHGLLYANDLLFGMISI